VCDLEAVGKTITERSKFVSSGVRNEDSKRLLPSGWVRLIHKRL